MALAPAKTKVVNCIIKIAMYHLCMLRSANVDTQAMPYQGQYITARAPEHAHVCNRQVQESALTCIKHSDCHLLHLCILQSELQLPDLLLKPNGLCERCACTTWSGACSAR